MNAKPGATVSLASVTVILMISSETTCPHQLLASKGTVVGYYLTARISASCQNVAAKSSQVLPVDLDAMFVTGAAFLLCVFALTVLPNHLDFFFSAMEIRLLHVSCPHASPLKVLRHPAGAATPRIQP